VKFKLPTLGPSGSKRPNMDPFAWAQRPPVPDEPDGIIRSRTASRARFIGGVVTLCMFTLMVKSSSLMMFPDPLLQSKANTQFNTALEIHGRRGDIKSADGALMATSVEVQSLHADPSKLTKDTAAVLSKAISPLLELDRKATNKRLNKNQRQDVLLARNLVPDQVSMVMKTVQDLIEQHPTLKHVLFTRNEYRRFYPAGSDAAPLLGVVGHSGTGLAGLERSLDRHLHGETYKYVQWRDRKGRHITADIPQARPGQGIVLTIDRSIQRIAEAALDEVMERSEPVGATAVVIDPKTGGIVALAQRPTHNPNDTRKLNSTALRNQVIADVFEPGSVFKPFIAAAAVEERLVTPETPINCENGRFRIGRTSISDEHPEGLISVSEVIKVSSNIGATKLAFSLGADRTLSYLKDFGFSRATHLGLAGEASGYMRNPKTIKPIELATTSYGHGVNATALQLAAAVATLGNGGVRMEPYVVAEIQDPDGAPIRVFEPTIDRRVISKETAQDVLDMMVLVTEKGGPGTRAAIPGYRVAGKTGTAWKHMDGGYSRTERIGSFIGVVPADNPRLAMAIVVDGPSKGSRFGGSTAGPAFKKIGMDSLRMMGVSPDPALIEHAEAAPKKSAPPPPTAAPELRWATNGKLIAPDLAGLSMRDALVTLEGAGLGIRISGSGRVIRQTPRAGRSLKPGDSVEVVLQ
jgi:cell division protein FtsI (penicillin-binding protein 3)